VNAKTESLPPKHVVVIGGISGIARTIAPLATAVHAAVEGCGAARAVELARVRVNVMASGVVTLAVVDVGGGAPPV